jgi:hypothetical protein
MTCDVSRWGGTLNDEGMGCPAGLRMHVQTDQQSTPAFLHNRCPLGRQQSALMQASQTLHPASWGTLPHKQTHREVCIHVRSLLQERFDPSLITSTTLHI